ncbi:response regulator transcription factor [Patulibacter sp. NPDC049589]|uniref:response regulator transcription factor n=1 Tax=Patulibacter sp. NPDC049589 TaxID=3154731 RepID=UPI003443C06F
MSTSLLEAHPRTAVAHERPAEHLTARELEITGLVCEGLTNGEIGARLYLSPRTVQSHLATAMEKLGVSSRTALAVQAIRRGVVPLFPDQDGVPARRWEHLRHQ